MSEGEGARALPPGWAWATLGEVGFVHCGQSPAASSVNETGDGAPYVTGPEHWDGKQLHLDKWTTDPKRFAPQGCFFVTVKGAGVGKVFPGAPCAIGRDIYAFEPEPMVSLPFSMLFTSHHIQRVLAEARGTIPGLSKSHIEEAKLLLPPSREQLRIVAKLDELLAASRRAREALDAVPALLDQYRRSVLAAAFRGELTATWSSQTNSAGNEQTPADVADGLTISLAMYDEIFAAPSARGWKIASLRSLVDDERGIPYGIVQTGDECTGGVPVVRCGDIKNGAIERDRLKRVNPSIVAQYRRTDLCGGEVLLAIRGSVGEAAVAPRELAGCNISREVAMIPLLTGVEPEFIRYLLVSPQGAKMLHTHVKGVAQSGINLADLRGLAVPLPPLAEQQEIVRRVDAAFSKIEAVRAHVAEQREKLDALDRAILDKAFRGDLVPQDPNDEPASVMLERLRAERAAEDTGKKPKTRRHARKEAP